MVGRHFSTLRIWMTVNFGLTLFKFSIDIFNFRVYRAAYRLQIVSPLVCMCFTSLTFSVTLKGHFP